MSNKNGPAWASFTRLFRETAPHHHRYDVFRDFVTMAAFALHNAVRKDERLEAEYMTIIGRYPREDANRFPKLLAELITLLDPEPWDALGQLYMELGIASEHVGQFFTPPELSELMARLTYGEELDRLKKPFVTVQEPACGAGGMILAFAKLMVSKGMNPAYRMWAHCQDVDRTAALMCYLQLALWNVPATVVVGNTLTMETREVFHTPAYYLGMWEYRLKRHFEEKEEELGNLIELESTPATTETSPEVLTPSEPPHETLNRLVPSPKGAQIQFDFGF